VSKLARASLPRHALVENMDDAAKLLLLHAGSVARAHAAITRNKGFLDHGSPDVVHLTVIEQACRLNGTSFGAAARELARKLLRDPSPEQEEAFIKRLRRLRDKILGS
jgi:hypothetical protein